MVVEARLVIESPKEDKESTWGFFDGAMQRSSGICSVGGVLFLNDTHFLEFKAGLGLGSNNYEVYGTKIPSKKCTGQKC